MTTPSEALRAKPALYRDNPCCTVPLDQEGPPDCFWHPYRRFIAMLARHLEVGGCHTSVSEEEDLCAQALRVQTQAQIELLRFLRRSFLADAQAEAAEGYTALEVMAKLTDRLNGLIAELER